MQRKPTVVVLVLLFLAVYGQSQLPGAKFVNVGNWSANLGAATSSQPGANYVNIANFPLGLNSINTNLVANPLTTNQVTIGYGLILSGNTLSNSAPGLGSGIVSNQFTTNLNPSITTIPSPPLLSFGGSSISNPPTSSPVTIFATNRYSAFPSLAASQNGTWLRIWNESTDSHEGDSEVLWQSSTNSGASWSATATLIPNGVTVDGHTGAAISGNLSLLPDGRLALTWCVFVGGQYAYVRYSTDSGASWSADYRLNAGYSGLTANQCITVSKVVPLAGGGYACSVYGANAGDTYNRSSVIFSADGFTWGGRVDLAGNGSDANYNETVIGYVQTASSTFLMALIRREDGHILRSVSLNNGSTWSTPVSVISNISPSFPGWIQMDSGVVWLGIRIGPFNGPLQYPAIVSSWDYGTNWSSPMILSSRGVGNYTEFLRVGNSIAAAPFGVETGGSTSSEMCWAFLFDGNGAANGGISANGALLSGATLMDGSLNAATNNTNGMVFSVGGTNKMWLNGNGNVGVGTSSPVSPLEVNGESSFDGDAYIGGTLFFSRTGTTGSSIIYSTANGTGGGNIELFRNSASPANDVLIRNGQKATLDVNDTTSILQSSLNITNAINANGPLTITNGTSSVSNLTVVGVAGIGVPAASVISDGMGMEVNGSVQLNAGNTLYMGKTTTGTATIYSTSANSGGATIELHNQSSEALVSSIQFNNGGTKGVTIYQGNAYMTNAPHLFATNAAPTGVVWGTTAPDGWLVIINNGTTGYVPWFVNH